MPEEKNARHQHAQQTHNHFFARQQRAAPWQEQGTRLRVSCHLRSIVDRLENRAYGNLLKKRGLMYCMRMVRKWLAIAW